VAFGVFILSIGHAFLMKDWLGFLNITFSLGDHHTCKKDRHLTSQTMEIEDFILISEWNL